ncbi:hypothetical protein NMQ14_12885 [Methyloversatilis sp. XJ19-13]|uniref:hypothetical protein n=1 Tax=Methyloversatilis sp. XJ19-13 TaxID=2963430 RepID=UPI00211C203F|nr:hypothetical protein [Methyloversatilis sp. XJ19-13]MCQ9375147.1 hypothetical protein [Methyloversatilis sp. XJ19-13]
MTKARLMAVGDGRAAHMAWEAVRGGENECDAERRLAADAEDACVDMEAWWGGWFERSDEWRDEIGHELDNSSND